MRVEKIDLVEDLDYLIEKGSKTSNLSVQGTPMPGSDKASAEAGMNFNSMNMNMRTPNNAQQSQQQASILQMLWAIYQEWLKKQKQKPTPMESTLREDLGYDNPYAIRQPQKGKRPEEDEEMALWDAITGRIRMFKANYGDAKPQDQEHSLKSSREQNRDMATGYSIAAANQRISQPSGGKDPRGFEIPTGWRTPVGAGKDEIDHNQAYNELMKRTQDNQQDPTQEQGAWQGHPAVDAFLDQVERLKEIEAANKTDAQGGAPQQMPGGGGENPMAAMMGGAGGGGENPMDMIQKMMGGKKEDDEEKSDGSGGDMMSMIQQMMGGGEGGMPTGDEEEKDISGVKQTSPSMAPPSQMGDVMKKDDEEEEDPSKLIQSLLSKLFGG